MVYVLFTLQGVGHLNHRLGFLMSLWVIILKDISEASFLEEDVVGHVVEILVSSIVPASGIATQVSHPLIIALFHNVNYFL